MDQAIPRSRRYLIWTSASLAIAAWALFITVHVIHRPYEPMLWILTAGWPCFYGFVLLIGFGIMAINQQGPVTSHWPDFLQSLFPSPIRWLLDRFYAAAGPTALILFPLFVFGMGSLLLYLELAGNAASPKP